MTHPLGRELTDADRATPEFQAALKASAAICAFIRGEQPTGQTAMHLFDCIRDIERWYRFHYQREIQW